MITTSSSSSADSSTVGSASNAGGDAAPRNDAPPPDSLRQQGSLFRSLLQTQSGAAQDQEAQAAPAEAEPVLGLPLPASGVPAALNGFGSVASWSGLDSEAEAEAAAPQDGAARLAADFAQQFQSPGFALWRRLQDDSRREADAELSQALAPAVLQAQAQNAAQIAEPMADPEAAFAALIERHIRQMLVSEPSASGADSIRIRLSDVALPDTTLSLSRVDGGWMLQAESGNEAARAALQRFTPALVARFAARSLGALEVVMQSESYP